MSMVKAILTHFKQKEYQLIATMQNVNCTHQRLCVSSGPVQAGHVTEYELHLNVHL